MAPRAGLEPATYGLTVHRSTNLTIGEKLWANRSEQQMPFQQPKTDVAERSNTSLFTASLLHHHTIVATMHTYYYLFNK